MIAAWLAHAFTASGVVLAFLAAVAVIDHDYRTAFFWLAMQIVVDAVDGMLARAARVSERLPWFNGAKLDDIIDYLTYVFIPALFVWRALLVPAEWTMPVVAAMLLSSLYGFNRDDAKTDDHFFTGFPSYWNIVVFYLLIGGWPKWVNAAVLLALAVLVFVPIRYIYPSRTPVFRWHVNALAAIWAAMMLTLLWQYPRVSRPLLWASLAFPLAYLVVSLYLSSGRSRAPSRVRRTLDHLRPRPIAGGRYDDLMERPPRSIAQRVPAVLLGVVIPMMLQAALVIGVKEMEPRLPGFGDVGAVLSLLTSLAIGFFFFRAAVSPQRAVLAGVIYVPIMAIVLMVWSLMIVGRLYGLSL